MRMFVVLAVVAAAMAAILAPAAQADWPATTCVDASTPIGNSSFVGGGTAQVSLTVGGVVQDNGTQTYIAEVCKDPSGLYNYMVGPKHGSTIDESGNSGPASYTAGTDQVVLSFTLSAGDVPKMVEGYGNISGFSISGQRVTITGTPGVVTQINYAGAYGGCMGNPYTGTYGGGSSCAAIPCYDTGTATGDPNCVDDLATFHGAVRLPGGGVDKTGMWITSAANLYAVGLNNCLTMGEQAAFAVRHGATTRQDGGANRPTPDISVQMVGPHYKTSGALNVGSIHAFIPAAVIQNCFGVDASTFQSGVGVTRQEGGTDTALVSGTGFTLSPVAGGLLLTVPTIGFSSPTYKITVPRAASSSSSTTTAGGSKPSTSTGRTIPGVAWSSRRGTITSTFARDAAVKAYKVSASKAGGAKVATRKSGSCAIKGAKVTCSVRGVTKGSWLVRITSTLKAGGAGPAASKTVVIK